jgi:hypothetical protein
VEGLTPHLPWQLQLPGPIFWHQITLRRSQRVKEHLCAEPERDNSSVRLILVVEQWLPYSCLPCVRVALLDEHENAGLHH